MEDYCLERYITKSNVVAQNKSCFIIYHYYQANIVQAQQGHDVLSCPFVRQDVILYLQR